MITSSELTRIQPPQLHMSNPPPGGISSRLLQPPANVFLSCIFTVGCSAGLCKVLFLSVSQVSDFVLLSAKPTLLLNCGSYGAGAGSIDR